MDNVTLFKWHEACRHQMLSSIASCKHVTVAPEQHNRSMVESLLQEGYVSLITDVMTPGSCVVGIVLILATMLLLQCRCLGKSTNTSYLLALGVSDVLSLLTLLLQTPRLLQSLPPSALNHIYSSTVAVYLSTLLQTNVMVANWITVVMAIDRHRAVCRPLEHYSAKAAAACQLRNHKTKIVGLIVLVATIVNLPQFFLFRSVYAINNGSTIIFVFSDLGRSQLYRNLHLLVVSFGLLLFLPTVIILSINIDLVITVVASTRIVNSASQLHISDNVRLSFRRENYKITALLFSLIVTFFFFQLPLVVSIFIYELFPTLFGSYSAFLFKNYTIFIYTLKNDCNFFFYLWLSKRFLKTIHAFVCMNCNHIFTKNSSCKYRISTSRIKSTKF